MGKASKGAVAIVSDQGRLKLRFRVHGQRRSFALGYPDTEKYRKLAASKAAELQADLDFGRFDPTLNKYRGVSPSVISVTLPELWQQYINVRRHLVQETTLKIPYRAVSSHLAKLPPDLLTPDKAEEIRDFWLQILTPDTVIRTLTQVSACCDRAVDLGKLTTNPFKGMASKLKKSFKSQQPQEIDPFSLDETLAIIAAFESDPHHGHYAPYVKFLFWTGCRTGEAIALTWNHVTPDCSEILFCESVSTQLKIRKQTKTSKIRRFPCTGQLQALLQSIHPDPCEGSRLVFPSVTGGEINARYFIQKVWKGRGNQPGIVTRLVSEGKVRRYRTQYNTRHTFITRELEQGTSPALIARWVGNSVQTIMKHYLGVTVNSLPHEVRPEPDPN